MYYPILKCINPEGFSGAVKKMECDEFERYYITSEDIEAPYFETKPISEEFEPPKDFPNCCNFHRSVLSQAIERMEKFPNCCEAHKRLKTAHWFNRKNYDGIPLKTVNTMVHTEYHILNRKDIEEWYKDITDYIEYCVSSFGRFPDGYGNPIALLIYLDNLELKIKETKDLPKYKKAKLIGYIKNIFAKTHEKAEGGINLLYSTYAKWLKTFPFELSIFQHLKEKYKKDLPFLKSEPVLNPYTGASKAKLKTQDELVFLLISITENILCEINTLTIYEKGLISDVSKLHIELAKEKRRLELKEMGEKPVDERGEYIKVLKQWFAGEVSFISELKLHLSESTPLPARMPTKAERLREVIVKHGFNNLPMLNVLRDEKRQALIQNIADNDLPYSVAMFDYLNFLQHLQTSHFPSAYKLYKEVAKWLGSNDKEGRNIKGNMSVLLPNSNEDKKRYTAHLHKEAVKNYYQSLK